MIERNDTFANVFLISKLLIVENSDEPDSYLKTSQVMSSKGLRNKNTSKKQIEFLFGPIDFVRF